MERLFEEIRQVSPPDIQYRSHVSPRFSKGVLGRLINMAAGRREAGDVNHVIGDVHYLAIALPGERNVLTVHDCAPLNRLRGWKRELLRLLWFEWPARRVRVVTTISETTRGELARWLSPSLASKIRVIHNCVRREFQFRPKTFDSSCPVILQVGTGWNKNVECVARALAGIPCHFEIVGELRGGQKNLLDELKLNYRALGKLSDVELVAAYERADLLLFASLYEGFGLPIVEAQATGRPVITSDRSAMPEVAGTAALFVNPEDVDSIRSALTRLINDAALRQSLIAAGIENVKRFRPETIAAQYAALYRELAATPRFS